MGQCYNRIAEKGQTAHKRGMLFMKATRKLIAPIIITIVCILALIAYMGVVFAASIPIWLKIAGAVALLVLIGVAIYVLFERIQEVRSGEEDDLGKY